MKRLSAGRRGTRRSGGIYLHASHALFAFFELMRTFCVKIIERLRTSADSCGLMRIVSRNFGTLYQNTCVLPRRIGSFDTITYLFLSEKNKSKTDINQGSENRISPISRALLRYSVVSRDFVFDFYKKHTIYFKSIENRRVL